MDPTAKLADEKKALRRAVRAQRGALSVDQVQAASRRLAEALAGLDELRVARTVAGYSALPGEIDPAPALADARRRGQRVVLPRIANDAHPRLRFHEVADGAALQPGPLGIAEPAPQAPEVAAASVDVFLVPGIAFDGDGRRVGQGGGYYDELVAHVRGAQGGPRSMFVGVGHDFQLTAAVPAGAGDQAVDVVVTPGHVVRAPRSA